MNKNAEQNAPDAKSNPTILIIALLTFGFLFGGAGACLIFAVLIAVSAIRKRAAA